MDPMITAGAISAGAGIVDSFIGMGMQRKQNERLLRQQIEAQKEMANFNYDLNKRYWDETNASAQVAHLKKAGLNVGLMYKGSGPGGATANHSGNVSGATAQMPSMDILSKTSELAMMKAQIDNIKADTEKKKTEVENVETQTQSLVQGIENAKVIKIGLEFENKIKEIQANLWGDDEYQTGEWNRVVFNGLKTMSEYNRELIQQGVDAETRDEKIALAEVELSNAILEGAAKKQGIELTKAQIDEAREKILNYRNERAATNRNLDRQETEMYINAVLGGLGIVSGGVAAKAMRDVVMSPTTTATMTTDKKGRHTYSETTTVKKKK